MLPDRTFGLPSDAKIYSGLTLTAEDVARIYVRSGNLAAVAGT